MDLSEHYDQADWLSNGWHEVEITSFRVFKANTGTEGVEFSVKANDNRAAKATFWLTEDAMKILGKFAKTCGLSRDAARNYRHDSLVGLRVQVLVIQDGRYQKVDDWAAIGEQREDPPARPQPAGLPPDMMRTIERNSVDGGATAPPSGVDIPF